MSINHARRVADSLLYEGYVLYPYRASALKNRLRWQFGVAMPPAYCERDGSETSTLQTDCLIEGAAGGQLDLRLRFLHVRRAEDRPAPTVPPGAPGGWGPVGDDWDRAVEREIVTTVPVDEVLAAAGSPVEVLIEVPGERAADPASAARWTSRDLQMSLILAARPADSPCAPTRLHVRVENRTRAASGLATRFAALPYALVSVHALLELSQGRFLSLQDPPLWARSEAERCEQTGWWACLAGPDDCENVLLAAPIIVSDHPELAPESPLDLYDATEIDEILVLRTLTLTDEEKAQARATDPRAAAVIDSVDTMPGEVLRQLHGAVRGIRRCPGADEPDADEPDAMAGSAPWWDPEADLSVDPAHDHIDVDGVAVRRGSRVRMLPGARAADAQDIFLAGRIAVVEAVLFDVDGRVHLAVTPEGDPAADLVRGPGRHLFFAPDEVEPLRMLP